MIETSETMPLSVAMRAGIARTYPVMGTLFNPERTGACALGAALLGVGEVGSAPPWCRADWVRRWPVLGECVHDAAVPCRCRRCRIVFWDHRTGALSGGGDRGRLGHALERRPSVAPRAHRGVDQQARAEVTQAGGGGGDT